MWKALKGKSFFMRKGNLPGHTLTVEGGRVSWFNLRTEETLFKDTQKLWTSLFYQLSRFQLSFSPVSLLHPNLLLCNSVTRTGSVFVKVRWQLQMRQLGSHTSPSVSAGLGERVEEATHTEPRLLMATLQPKKANNLEIIKHTLRLKIDKRAPVSNSFSSAPFINRAEYLRTHWKEEKKAAKCSVESGSIYKLGVL